MAYNFKLTCNLSATPEEVFDAWLGSKGHSEMTGAKARTTKRAGAAFLAWDGYIVGKNIDIVPGKRIVQSWRTSEFPEAHADSTITITLSPVKSGCKLTLLHAGVPDGQTSYEDNGWRDFYFVPMKKYFASKSTNNP